MIVLLLHYNYVIFNESFKTGKLLLCWKHSVVTPVFKKENPAAAESYWPISLISIACKYMQFIVCDALLDHLVQNYLLAHYQHGFLAGHSTGA